MRRIRDRLAGVLRDVAYWIEPEPKDSGLDPADLIRDIEPLDTPFLRSIKR